MNRHTLDTENWHYLIMASSKFDLHTSVVFFVVRQNKGLFWPNLAAESMEKPKNKFYSLVWYHCIYRIAGNFRGVYIPCSG